MREKERGWVLSQPPLSSNNKHSDNGNDMFVQSASLTRTVPARLSRSRVVSVSAIKKWKMPERTASGKQVKQKLNVSVGDTVQVVAGKDKGKVSTVTGLRTATNQITCKDIAMVTKAQKSDTEGEAGQLIKYEGWLHSSNVMHYSEKEKTRSRLGHKMVDGKKVRYLVKTGEILPSPWENKQRIMKEMQDEASKAENENNESN